MTSMVYRVIKKGGQTRDIPKAAPVPDGWKTVGFVVVHSTNVPDKHRRGQRVNATKTPVTEEKALSIDRAININKQVRKGSNIGKRLAAQRNRNK